MRTRRAVDLLSAGPSTSSASQLRNHNHGLTRSLFGCITPVGRRTSTKRTPRCPTLRKPSLDLKVSEGLDVDVATDSTVQKKSSKYKGVTKHRVTGRYEAHLWDKYAYNDKQKKKGRQVYLGAYDEETLAAQAYDLAALKYWGPGTSINFKLENYIQHLKEMEIISRGEYLAILRRKSSGFSRGLSKYRGVARHHHNGRWEARIGRVEGNKYLYLGTFGTQEEAAEAYDRAAIRYRGAAAVTNFELSRYTHVVPNIPAKNGRKNKTTNTRFKGKPSQRHSAPAMQLPENVNRTLDGVRDSALPESQFHGGMKPINCQDSLKVLEFPDYTNHLDAETSIFLQPAKQEGYPNSPDSSSQPIDLTSLETSEYEFGDEFLESFGVPPLTNLVGI